ncbi:MAG: 23S rRNA (pseudouridine(1915)-N(3))-methyltransferase RlmH [Candidatus Altiarchaeota archaeon]|nr:23S rRNA (pseudouridine(1915)-N(3))-methyltransferase RlmH [Candidatus Altiarchaeota archaeon]
MTLRIVCVGRLKERHYAEAAQEYLKRLGKYAKVEVAEIREQSDKNIEVAKRKEAALLKERIGQTQKGLTIALDRTGIEMSSEEFSHLLKKTGLTFIIGGPDGLSKEVLDEAGVILSLSLMTLPHQLARVVLLEQIYRGFTILNGGKYHK